MNPALLALSMMAAGGVSQATIVVNLDGRNTGVTAEIENPTLTGDTFTFSVQDSSVPPGTTGYITSIGFDLPNLSGVGSDGADRGTFTLVSETDANFTLVVDDKATATGLNITHLDFPWTPARTSMAEVRIMESRQEESKHSLSAETSRIWTISISPSRSTSGFRMSIREAATLPCFEA
jgi:hypothetical protein